MGHHYRDAPAEAPPIPARLSCTADKLAGAYCRQMRKPCKRAEFFPAARVAIHQAEEDSITYRLVVHLRHFRTSPPLKDYILERNATWTQNTYHDVDWPGHQAAVKALEPYKVTLVKHLHGNLPVGSRFHRRDPRYSHSCPYCGEPQETDEHLYTCQSESREMWRRQFLQKLHALLDEEGTLVGVMMVAVAGVENLFYGRDAHLPEYVDPVNQRLASRQAAIGWDNLLHGCISKAWSSLQRQQRAGDRDGKWAKKLAMFLLQQFIALWRQRNEDRHGRDMLTQREADHSKVLQVIKFYYEWADCVPPVVAEVVFCRPLHELSEDMIVVLKAWLANCT